MSETSGGNENLFGKLGKFRRRILPTSAELTADSNRIKLEDSFNEALSKHDLHLMCLKVKSYSEYDNSGSEKTAGMLESTLDVIDFERHLAAPTTSSLTGLQSTMGLILMIESLRLSDAKKLQELEENSLSVLSACLPSKPRSGGLFPEEIRKEVKKDIAGLQKRKQDKPLKTDQQYADKVIEKLRAYIILGTEQAKKNIEISESLGDLGSMATAYKEYSALIGETDTPELREIVRRAGVVMEKMALGQLPSQPNWSMETTIQGATAFLIEAAHFDYHQSQDEFDLFREVAGNFHSFAVSPGRVGFTAGPGLKNRIYDCQQIIVKAISERRRAANDRIGINTEIARKLEECRVGLRSIRVSTIDGPKTPYSKTPDVIVGPPLVSAVVWDADKRRDITHPEAVAVVEPTRIEIPFRIGETIVMNDGMQYRVDSFNSGGQFIIYKTRTEIGGVSKIVCLRTERLGLQPAERMNPLDIVASQEIMQDLISGAPDKIGARILEPHGIHYDKKRKWYFQSAWVEGESLQDKMDKVPTMDEGFVRSVIIKVAETLVYINEEKLVGHCDIKPANIIITPNWEPVLIDFDVARRLDPKTGSVRTKEVICTPAYAANEQFSGVVTAKSDCHAVGVMIYEMLTGEGQTLMKDGMPLLSNNKVEDRLPKINDLSEKWKTIIRNCTLHDASQRWSVKQLLDALNAPDVPNAPPVREPFSLD